MKALSFQVQEVKLPSSVFFCFLIFFENASLKGFFGTGISFPIAARGQLVTSRKQYKYQIWNSHQNAYSSFNCNNMTNSSPTLATKIEGSQKIKHKDEGTNLTRPIAIETSHNFQLRRTVEANFPRKKIITNWTANKKHIRKLI